mmetsp:Transcript_26840/g.52515  ORF Transcript_26840/g.52515 Transcript_26840/m.52515 type:complete len:228 (+) Transcript_26840:1340-2023(+)
MKMNSLLRCSLCSVPKDFSVIGAKFQFQKDTLLNELLPFNASIILCVSAVTRPSCVMPGMSPSRPQPQLGSPPSGGTLTSGPANSFGLSVVPAAGSVGGTPPVPMGTPTAVPAAPAGAATGTAVAGTDVAGAGGAADASGIETGTAPENGAVGASTAAGATPAASGAAAVADETGPQPLSSDPSSQFATPSHLPDAAVHMPGGPMHLKLTASPEPGCRRFASGPQSK